MQRSVEPVSKVGKYLSVEDLTAAFLPWDILYTGPTPTCPQLSIESEE